MVNNKTAKIKTILAFLSSTDEPVSGEKLASKLGISRVAVWKIISGLKNTGYQIESTHSGYRLISATDKPVPWELGGSRRNIYYHDEIDSTMQKASALIDAGCSNGTTIIAGCQTAGLNAKGGRWKSPDGGLYITRIRTLPFPAYYTGLYTTAAAAAAAEMLRESYEVKAVVKWPGSIECDGRKLGGVLTEFKGHGDEISSTAAGIGFNLNSSLQLPEGAAALCEITGNPVSVKKFAIELLKKLEELDNIFPLVDAGHIYPDFIQQAGKQVTVEKAQGSQISGEIIKLDISGALILQTKDECMEYIFSGDRILYE